MQNDLNLLTVYTSTFLVGHDKYSYIIFDRKYEYTNKNRLVIVSYKFQADDLVTKLKQPLCLKRLQQFIQIKTISTRIHTGLKSVMPHHSGQVYIFFENQFCITDIAQQLQVRFRDCQLES